MNLGEKNQCNGKLCFGCWCSRLNCFVFCAFFDKGLMKMESWENAFAGINSIRFVNGGIDSALLQLQTISLSSRALYKLVSTLWRRK